MKAPLVRAQWRGPNGEGPVTPSLSSVNQPCNGRYRDRRGAAGARPCMRHIAPGCHRRPSGPRSTALKTGYVDGAIPRTRQIGPTPKTPRWSSMNAILLGARRSGALPGVTSGLLAPDPQAVGRTAKLRRNRLAGRTVAGMIGTVLAKQPNNAFAQLGRMGGGESPLCHGAHPLSVSLSGTPGAVQGGYHRALSDRLTELEMEQDGLIARLSDAAHDVPDMHPNIAETYRRRIERLTAALDHPTARLKRPMRCAKSSTASSSPPTRNTAATRSACKANSAPSSTGSGAPENPATSPSPTQLHPVCRFRSKLGHGRRGHPPPRPLRQLYGRHTITKSSYVSVVPGVTVANRIIPPAALPLLS